MWLPVAQCEIWVIQQVVHSRQPGTHGLCLTTSSNQDTITVSNTLHYAPVGYLIAFSLRERPFFMYPPLFPLPRASGESDPTAWGSGGSG